MERELVPLNEMVDLSSEVEKEILPYDSAYPIQLLTNGLKRKFEVAQSAAEKICNEVIKYEPAVSQIQKATKKGFRYVVDASDDMLSAIDTGKVKLSTTKAGKVTAQLRMPNGQFGEKLPIKKEVFRQGLDLAELGNALQMMALQEQLQGITNQIAVIEQNVKDVLRGQQNDRLGLYYSGLALYLESKSISDEQLRKALMVQAIRSLSDASFQLTVTMQADMKYLIDGKYNLEKGKKKLLIDEKMNSINESFEFIHQASMLRAAIYCEENEMESMMVVLQEYSHFIENTISKNAGLLSQCDFSDNGTEEGTWNTRAKLRLDVSEIAKKLKQKDKVFYIGVSEEEYNE